mgnify:CR=1 FL=1
MNFLQFFQEGTPSLNRYTATVGKEEAQKGSNGSTATLEFPENAIIYFCN